MNITKLTVQNFMRFTNLTIDLQGQKPRLVLLVGSNGSGKTSVLSLFHLLKWRNKDKYDFRSAPNLEADLAKDRSVAPSYSVWFEPLVGPAVEQATETNFKVKNEYNIGTSLYGRSAMINLSRLASYPAPSDEELKQDFDMSKTLIDIDNRFANDLAYTLQEVIKISFSINGNTKQYLDDLLNRINNSLKRIFEKDNCVQIEKLAGGIGSDPIEVLIRKGPYTFGYERLSQGEKNVLNVIFNLWRRVNLFPDAIYYLDELDQHLERKIQYNFLKEIVQNWLPENAQLWTASHSLGFMEYAADYPEGLIIDFDDLDFDLPQVLTPIPKLTSSAASVAVDIVALSRLLPDYKVLATEGKDHEYYNNFSIGKFIISSRHDKYEVYEAAIKSDNHIYGIIDRDFLSDQEVELLEKKFKKLAILRYYSIENYLFHPDNLLSAGLINSDQSITLKETIVFNYKKLNLIGQDRSSVNKGRNSQKYLMGKVSKKEEETFIKHNESVYRTFESDDFEVLWKVIKAKDYFYQLANLQLNTKDPKLSKSQWISEAINSLTTKFNQA